MAPFTNIGISLITVRHLNRNAVVFDLKKKYIDFSTNRLNQTRLGTNPQILVDDDTLNIPNYLEEESVDLSITSPTYANTLNHPRKNKNIRGNKRNNEHFETIKQYHKDPRDLGTVGNEEYSDSPTKIYKVIYLVTKKKGHVIIKVNGEWENNKHYAAQVYVIHSIEKTRFGFRNTIMWSKKKSVNNAGIFGYPSNYITLGTTMEFINDFWKRGE